jgi:hypothetical protein
MCAQGLFLHLQALATDSYSGSYSLKDGLIYFKNRIMLPATSGFPWKVFLSLHAAPIGHSGFAVTYHKIKKLFVWIGMKKMIKTWCSECSVCQQARPERVKYLGLLQPIPVPDGAWKTISMDFIEGLPHSCHSNCILVIVDTFSKYGHFIPMTHPFTALSVAQQFMDQVLKLHGLPQAIISDWDMIFTSAFWKELFKLVGVDLRMTTSYHPQSDGQTERVNQCLETYLRCFVHACPSKWRKWLSLAEYWYNTSYHSSLGYTPFDVLYGHLPRQLGLDLRDSCIVPALQDWMHKRKLMVQLVQQQLARAQQRYKTQADKHRSERTFEVGDMVYLKLQPYVQSSLVKRANHKLTFKYFGPFPVVAKVGAVAYKLGLPEYTSIHPVFHVSLLKKAVGSQVQVSPTLPPFSDPLQWPESILQRRKVATDNGEVTQVLVKWSEWPEELATWEMEDHLKRRFPKAPAWGQASFQGGRNVTGLDTNLKLEKPRRERRPNRKWAGPEWAK